MIFVDGVPFTTDPSSEGSNALVALMEHSSLVSVSNSFKAIPERKFSVNEESSLERSKKSKWVYVFQREYATADPALVDFIGTDEATTCVGVVIRNKQNGMTSVAHMDSLGIVDMGLSQMLSLVVDQNSDAYLEYANSRTRSKGGAKLEGYSYPLCAKIVESMCIRQEKFHIRTFFVLGHNTKRDSEGNAYPIFNGLAVETSTGSVIPSCFDRTSRCPDEIVRRIRVTASYEDPSWNGKLLETYDTQTDKFRIAPCHWTFHQKLSALTRRNFPDSEIILRCSTSPLAEGPDFVNNLRRLDEFLIEHPDWRETFPMNQPRVFERAGDGGWKKC